MWTMLAGVPGRLKTLLDRLTAARAANLDNLNATISSRAPASTALSNMVWTPERATKIDGLRNIEPVFSVRALSETIFQTDTFYQDGAAPAIHEYTIPAGSLVYLFAIIIGSTNVTPYPAFSKNVKVSIFHGSDLLYEGITLVVNKGDSGSVVVNNRRFIGIGSGSNDNFHESIYFDKPLTLRVEMTHVSGSATPLRRATLTYRIYSREVVSV